MEENCFVWSDKLSTGNAIIDIQHREIISRISALMHTLPIFKDADMLPCASVEEAIHFLYDYVLDHFTLEEKMMIQTAYQDFGEHRDDHTRYVKFIFKLKSQPSITNEMIDEVRTALPELVLEHIFKQDMKMARHLVKYGSSMGR